MSLQLLKYFFRFSFSTCRMVIKKIFQSNLSIFSKYQISFSHFNSSKFFTYCKFTAKLDGNTLAKKNCQFIFQLERFIAKKLSLPINYSIYFSVLYIRNNSFGKKYLTEEIFNRQLSVILALIYSILTISIITMKTLL